MSHLRTFRKKKTPKWNLAEIKGACEVNDSAGSMIRLVAVSAFTAAAGECCVVCCCSVPQSLDGDVRSCHKATTSQWDWCRCPWPSPHTSCLHYGRWWSEAGRNDEGRALLLTEPTREITRSSSGINTARALRWDSREKHHVKRMTHFWLLSSSAVCIVPCWRTVCTRYFIPNMFYSEHPV